MNEDDLEEILSNNTKLYVALISISFLLLISICEPFYINTNKINELRQNQIELENLISISKSINIERQKLLKINTKQKENLSRINSILYDYISASSNLNYHDKSLINGLIDLNQYLYSNTSSSDKFNYKLGEISMLEIIKFQQHINKYAIFKQNSILTQNVNNHLKLNRNISEKDRYSVVAGNDIYKVLVSDLAFKLEKFNNVLWEFQSMLKHQATVLKYPFSDFSILKVTDLEKINGSYDKKITESLEVNLSNSYTIPVINLTVRNKPFNLLCLVLLNIISLILTLKYHIIKIHNERIQLEDCGLSLLATLSYSPEINKITNIASRRLLRLWGILNTLFYIVLLIAMIRYWIYYASSFSFTNLILFISFLALSINWVKTSSSLIAVPDNE